MTFPLDSPARFMYLELNVSGASHDGSQVGGAGAHVSQAGMTHEGVTLLLHCVLNLHGVGKHL